MLQIPKHTTNAKLDHVSPTDQIDGWTDIGLTRPDSPVQFWCDMYIAPSGHGFTISCCVNVEGTIWANQMHFGPESYRGTENFRWLPKDADFARRFPVGESVAPAKKLEVLISYRADAAGRAQQLFRKLGEYKGQKQYFTLPGFRISLLPEHGADRGVAG